MGQPPSQKGLWESELFQDTMGGSEGQSLAWGSRISLLIPRLSLAVWFSLSDINSLGLSFLISKWRHEEYVLL